MVTALVIIALVVICIIILMNFNKILQFLNKIKEKIILPQKVKIFFKMLIVIILIMIIIIVFIYVIKELISAINDKTTLYEQNAQILDTYGIEAEQIKKHSNQINKTYKNSKSDEPYIPEGFHYVEGTWNAGYVIEDNSGNQFVWIPCNSENLSKSDFDDDSFISYLDCWETNDYEKFLTSALENGGFYISRYEIGIENEKIVSKYEAETLVNITRDEIEEKITETFQNNNYNIEIINGYAYDRTISWIMEENDDIKINDLEIYEDDIVLTGRASYNNVFDIFDDMFEITSENYFINCLVYRGFSDSQVDLDSIDEEISTRYVSVIDDLYTNCNITSRLMLYK